jgi:lipopolysaccharide/colanic/teichoic acid biosynthesis glycosyltransferase
MVDVALPRIEQADDPADARRGYLAAKRTLDVGLAGLLLLVASPLLLIVALAVKLDSPGPVIFAQQRMRGLRRSEGGGSWVIEPFTLYKFRTMHNGADHSPHQEYMRAYLRGDEERLRALRPDRREGQSFRPANDHRVTHVGRVLRKTSLDELPQLWNVLRGDMSLVGPRPPIPYEVDMYQASHMHRLASPPGMTGWAQVKGRCSLGVEDMVRLDLEYIGRRSIWLDVRILLATIPVVLMGRGAD